MEDQLEKISREECEKKEHLNSEIRSMISYHRELITNFYCRNCNVNYSRPSTQQEIEDFKRIILQPLNRFITE